MSSSLLDRRAFAATIAAPLLGAPALDIVDTHTHFYDPSRPGGVPWPPKSDALLYQTYLPDRYARLVQPLGVRSTIAIEASALFEDNQWLLGLAKNHPVIKGVVGHLEPGRPPFAANLARFARNPLFLGIRLNDNVIASGMAQPSFLADLRILADADLALDAIGGPAVFASVLKLTDKVPNLRVIVDHLPIDGEQQEPAFREAAQRPRIYAKVSGVVRKIGSRVPIDVESYRDDLDSIWGAFGPRRVVYASNWPVSERMAPYATVLKVVRDYVKNEDRAAFFHDNARAFYKWK